MHKASVASLIPGSALGKTIWNVRGEVLLSRGMTLTPRYIKALTDRGHESLYVLDGIADDVEPLGLISDHLRTTAVANLRSVFGLISHATHVMRDEAACDGAHVIRDSPLVLGTSVDNELTTMVSVADTILDEVLEQDSLAGMAALKSHDTYTFEHSVEVAVYGIMLGRRVGLSRPLLKDVALGCLLHDIGKLYVDERVLNKPGKLDTTEFEQIMEHPLLGFQLVRQMPIESPRPAAIVLQHHERQDGNGYPNRLFGTNRIARTALERFDTRRISLMAEIAAIADVYSALASDRPYRAALPPDGIFRIMQQEAGQHLNGDVLRAFVTLVQQFPVGARVRLSGGIYHGYLGVVVDVASNAPSQPTVRLMFDATGGGLGEGNQIDMRQQSSTVRLHILPDSGQTLDTFAHWQDPAAPLSA